jgi:ABC-type uncharacterized transport system permease subunit
VVAAGVYVGTAVYTVVVASSVQVQSDTVVTVAWFLLAATPLLLATLGETIAERAGVMNVALEGCIIAGAYAAYVGATHPALGYGMSLGAGIAEYVVAPNLDLWLVAPGFAARWDDSGYWPRFGFSTLRASRRRRRQQ